MTTVDQHDHRVAAPGRRPRPLRRAHTLVELVMVLLIIATFAGIAVPRYTRSLQRYRVDSVARRLVADLDYARREAMAATVGKTVSFSLVTGSYTVFGVPDPDRGPGPYVVDVGAEPYRCEIVSVAFDDPLDDADDPASLVFDGYGLPDSGGVVIVRCGAQQRVVAMDSDSGRAAIQ